MNNKMSKIDPMSDAAADDLADSLWITAAAAPGSQHSDELLDEYERELERTCEQSAVDKEHCEQKLFHSFQQSACAVAQMFKDKSHAPPASLNSWNSFQNAAGAITVLYKDALDACKVNVEMGVGVGQQRKCKELLGWLRKKKRRNTIRKDDLISFLMGKQVLHHHHHHHVSRAQRSQEAGSGVESAPASTDADLATFHEALVMHNRSSSAQQQHQHHHNQSCDDLNCFFCQQIATHIEHKRSASSMDMDSPTRKRGRFY